MDTQQQLLYVTTAHGLRVTISVESSGEVSPDEVGQAIVYISTHLTEDISLRTIAEAIGVSQFHLARKFKQATGESVRQYIIVQRLKVARLLLETGVPTVAQVAQQVGFFDQSHLHRFFLRQYGVSPRSVLMSSKIIQKERTIVQDSDSVS